MSIFYNIPTKKIIDQAIAKYGKEINRIDFFIDLQNYSLGIYIYDEHIHLINLYEYTLHEFYRFIYTLADTIDYGEYRNVSVRFYLFTDRGRNLFNENIVDTWKENRKKSLSEILIKNPEHLSVSRLKKLSFKAIQNALNILSKKSKNIFFFNLQNIDSDFLPGFVYLIRAIKNTLQNTLHVIISSDHDYYHLTNYNNIVLFSPLSKQNKNIYQQIILDDFNIIVQRVMKKYNLKEFSDAILVTRFYSLFHALIGDMTDSIPSLIKNFGIIRWLNLLKDELNEYENVEHYLNNLQNTKLYEMLNKNKIDINIFAKRLLLTDFILFSKVLFHVDRQDKNLFNVYLQNDFAFNVYEKLEYHQIQVLKTVVDEIEQSLAKEKCSQSEIKRFTKFFAKEDMYNKLEKIF